MQVIRVRGFKILHLLWTTIKEFLKFPKIQGVVEIGFLDKIAHKFKRIQ